VCHDCAATAEDNVPWTELQIFSRTGHRTAAVYEGDGADEKRKKAPALKSWRLKQLMKSVWIINEKQKEEPSDSDKAVNQNISPISRRLIFSFVACRLGRAIGTARGNEKAREQCSDREIKPA